MNCSSRVNSHFTGRPVFSVASTHRSSDSISCLPPNPPPTRSVKTCTSRGGRPNRWQSFCCAMKGPASWCGHATARRRPSRRWSRASPDARAGRGRWNRSSRARRRRLRSHRATLPISPWMSAKMLPVLGSALVVQERRAGRHRGVGIEHGGQELVVHIEQPAGRCRRRPRVSATTAATRWPTNRTTLSSM